MADYASALLDWATRAIETNNFPPAHFVIWELELRGLDFRATMEEHAKGG